MAFWSVNGPEPKRNYRWIVRFGGDLQNISFALKTVTKPSAEIKSIQHMYLNGAFNYPGRLIWKDISMKFAAVSEPDATYLVDLMAKRAGYGVPLSEIRPVEETATIGKNKFVDALGTIDIVQIDANGEDLETWKLFNPFFSDIKYGSLDYSNEEITEIEVTVKYDWAQLFTGVPTDQSQALGGLSVRPPYPP